MSNESENNCKHAILYSWTTLSEILEIVSFQWTSPHPHQSSDKCNIETGKTDLHTVNICMRVIL